MIGRFSILLLMILGLFATEAVVAEWRTHGGAENYRAIILSIETVAYAALLLTAALTVAETRGAKVATGLLAVLTIAAAIGSIFWDSPVAQLLQSGLTTVFLGLIVALIVRHLFRCRSVDLDTLASSICVYLVIALFFVAVNSVIVQFDPAAFVFPDSDSEGTEQLEIGSMQSVHGLYYSLVTLTTLGYGDITPTSATARLAAAIEAVIGQIFLTVLVARLVGLHLSITLMKTDEEDLLDQDDIADEAEAAAEDAADEADRAEGAADDAKESADEAKQAAT